MDQSRIYSFRNIIKSIKGTIIGCMLGVFLLLHPVPTLAFTMNDLWNSMGLKKGDTEGDGNPKVIPNPQEEEKKDDPLAFNGLPIEEQTNYLQFNGKPPEKPPVVTDPPSTDDHQTTTDFGNRYVNETLSNQNGTGFTPITLNTLRGQGEHDDNGQCDANGQPEDTLRNGGDDADHIPAIDHQSGTQQSGMQPHPIDNGLPTTDANEVFATTTDDSYGLEGREPTDAPLAVTALPSPNGVIAQDSDGANSGSNVGTENRIGADGSAGGLMEPDHSRVVGDPRESDNSGVVGGVVEHDNDNGNNDLNDISGLNGNSGIENLDNTGGGIEGGALEITGGSEGTTEIPVNHGQEGLSLTDSTTDTTGVEGVNDLQGTTGVEGTEGTHLSDEHGNIGIQAGGSIDGKEAGLGFIENPSVDNPSMPTGQSPFVLPVNSTQPQCDPLEPTEVFQLTGDGLPDDNVQTLGHHKDEPPSSDDNGLALGQQKDEPSPSDDNGHTLSHQEGEQPPPASNGLASGQNRPLTTEKHTSPVSPPFSTGGAVGDVDGDVNGGLTGIGGINGATDGLNDTNGFCEADGTFENAGGLQDASGLEGSSLEGTGLDGAGHEDRGLEGAGAHGSGNHQDGKHGGGLQRLDSPEAGDGSVDGEVGFTPRPSNPFERITTQIPVSDPQPTCDGPQESQPNQLSHEQTIESDADPVNGNPVNSHPLAEQGEPQANGTGIGQKTFTKEQGGSAHSGNNEDFATRFADEDAVEDQLQSDPPQDESPTNNDNGRSQSKRWSPNDYTSSNNGTCQSRKRPNTVPSASTSNGGNSNESFATTIDDRESAGDAATGSAGQSANPMFSRQNFFSALGIDDPKENQRKEGGEPHQSPLPQENQIAPVAANGGESSSVPTGDNQDKLDAEAEESEEMNGQGNSGRRSSSREEAQANKVNEPSLVEQPLAQPTVIVPPSYDTSLVAALPSAASEAIASQTSQLFFGHHRLISQARRGQSSANAVVQKLNGSENDDWAGVDTDGLYSYLRLFAGRQRMQASGDGLAGYRMHGYGFETGVFKVIDSEWLVGVMMSGWKGYLALKNIGASEQLNGVRIGPFFFWQRGALHMDGALTASYHAVDVKGHDSVNGTDYHGDFNQRDISAWLGIGYDIALTPSLTLTPMAETLMMVGNQSNFTLKGRDGNRIHVKNGTRQDRIDRLGLTLHYQVPTLQYATAIRAGAGVQHNHFAPYKVAMQANSDNTLRTERQQARERKSNWYSLGIQTQLSEVRSLSFDIDGSKGKKSSAIQGSVTFEHKF